MLGVSNAFDMPTRQAFAIEMVGRKDLMNAVALNSGMFNGARLIGPAIGGFLISVAGVEAVFLLNGHQLHPGDLSACWRSASRNCTPPSASRHRGTRSRSCAKAFGTPCRRRATRLIFILVAMIGTFGYNFTVMLPLITRYVLHEGSVVLGFLTAAVGLGAFIAAIFLAGRKAATRYQLFAGGIAFATLLAGVALSTNIYVTLVLLMFLGAAGATFGTTANTSVQIATPDHLRGRVVSLYMLLFAGSTPIGGYLTGYTAEHIGTQEAIGMLAAMCAVGVVLGTAYYLSDKTGVERTADASHRHAEVTA